VAAVTPEQKAAIRAALAGVLPQARLRADD